MAELIISSKDNRNVKLLRSLADKKGRRASGLFLAEGVANIREALASDLQAEMLLRDTKFPSYKIGMMVGFPSEANFIRHFRNKNGVTPGEYRAACLG